MASHFDRWRRVTFAAASLRTCHLPARAHSPTSRPRTDCFVRTSVKKGGIKLPPQVPLSATFSFYVVSVEPERCPVSVGEKQTASRAIRRTTPAIKFKQQVLVAHIEVAFCNLDAVALAALVDKVERGSFFY